MRLPKFFTRKTADKAKPLATTETKITKPEEEPTRERLKPFDLRHRVIHRIFGSQGCLSCGRPLQYNNPKQVVLWCSKLCHWARHNRKYLHTKRGHK